jgi:hypothetical protein
MLPIHRRFRTTLATAFVALTAAAALAACDDPLGPDVAQQSTPFYYYENGKIYLRVEPTRLTAVPETQGDTATFRAVLAQAGVKVDSVRPLWMQDHWFIHLAPGTSARQAEKAARQLRLDDGVRFASAAYNLKDDSCPLYMVNRLVVQYRVGTNPDEIARLNAATGVRNEQVEVWGTLYEYPADMAATPLELAAHYYRQRIVDWAEADRINGCLRIGVESPRP